MGEDWEGRDGRVGKGYMNTEELVLRAQLLSLHLLSSLLVVSTFLLFAHTFIP